MRRHLAACAAVATVLLATPSAATAATEANYSITYCDGGSNVGVGTNDLSLGTVRMGWCKNSNNRATTITVKYEKDGGPAITARFGYRWTNSSGGNIGGTHWDSTGTVRIAAGEKWGARFRRNPAQAAPDGQKCIQGLLKVAGQGTFPTHTVCR